LDLRDEIMGQWRKLHSGELHNFYSSPDIIRQIKSRRMRWAGHVVPWERGEKCTGFWWESPKERPLERPRRRWEDESKWVGWEGADWILLAQDKDLRRAVVNAVMNLRVLAPRNYLISAVRWMCSILFSLNSC
jgi:hypothetical protein